MLYMFSGYRLGFGEIEIPHYFFNLQGVLLNHRTKTRLVCIHFTNFSCLDDNNEKFEVEIKFEIFVLLSAVVDIHPCGMG